MEHVVPPHWTICCFCSLGRPKGLGTSINNMACSLPGDICALSVMSLTPTPTTPPQHTHLHLSTWSVSKTLGGPTGVPYQVLQVARDCGKVQESCFWAQGIAPPTLCLLPIVTHINPSSVCWCLPQPNWGNKTLSGPKVMGTQHPAIMKATGFFVDPCEIRFWTFFRHHFPTNRNVILPERLN